MADVKSVLLDKIIKYGYKYELNKSPKYLIKLNQYVTQYDSFILSGGGKEFDKMKMDMLSTLKMIKKSITQDNYYAELRTVLRDLDEKHKKLIFHIPELANQKPNFIPLSNLKEAEKLLEEISLHIKCCEIISSMAFKEKSSYDELITIQTRVGEFCENLRILYKQINLYVSMPRDEREKIQQEFDKYLEEKKKDACDRLNKNEYGNDANKFRDDTQTVANSAYDKDFNEYFQGISDLPQPNKIHTEYCKNLK
jgi:hypothetical protein